MQIIWPEFTQQPKFPRDILQRRRLHAWVPERIKLFNQQTELTMNKPSDPDPFQRLTNRLRESTFSTLAGGARAQSSIDEHSDGEQTSKIGNMVVLNNEAHLPRHAINRTSCELRMASTNYANQSWKESRPGCVTASLGMPLIYSSYLIQTLFK